MSYYSDDLVTLHHGDCLDVLREMPDSSVDAVVTDPPYGLSFMGKTWDRPTPRLVCEECGNDDATEGYRVCVDCLPVVGDGAKISDHGGRAMLGHVSKNWHEKGTHSRGYADNDNIAFGAWCQQWAAECLRVLKPGGHMLAFGGTRTWHRLAVAVEDAGFEVRDSIAWLYGSGFPKSLDVSKAIDKSAGIWRGKAGEQISDNGSMSAPNYARTDKGQPATAAAAAWNGWGTALKPAFEPIVVGRKPLAGTVAANVLAHGTGALNIDGCRVPSSDTFGGGGSTNGSPFAAEYELGTGFREGSPLGRWPANVVLDERQAGELDRQSGTLTSGANPTRRGSDKFRNAYGDFVGQEECEPARGADSGGASRFFPTFRYEAKAPTVERPRDGDTAHPTVKPLDLMRWLVRLVTPPGGTVLEPFAGSGTTAEACVIEGFRCIAIEREAAYLPLIVARLSKPIQPDLFGGAA